METYFEGDLVNIFDLERLFTPYFPTHKGSPRISQRTVDISNLTFISPLGAVSLLLLLEKLGDFNHLEVLPPNEMVVSYMDRMNFFQNCSKNIKQSFAKFHDLDALANRNRNDKSKELLEITPIKEKKDIGKIFDATFNILNSNGLSSREVNKVALIVSEFATNILAHSEGIGMAAIQTYPSIKKVVIAIGDNGIGIVRALKPILKSQEVSDLTVINKAFEKRVSSKQEEERGMGLFTVRKKTFLDTKKASFFIRTHKGTYKILSNRIEETSEGNYFPGTYILLEISF
jgi:anti-sigma regulatory factor (Ser/Thr protein kinase)